MRRVLIIDDHTLIASTLTGALRYRGYDARGYAPRSDEKIIEAVRSFDPVVVLLDLEIGVDRTSQSLIAPIRATGCAVVMVTGTTDTTRLAECIEAGAAGALSKAARVDELVEAIETVANGGTLLGPSERDEMLSALQHHRDSLAAERAAFDRLTPKEQKVLGALMQGKTAQVIAAETFTSVSTVRNHIQKVLDKLKVSSQLAAVAMAIDAAWQPPAEGDSS